VHARVACLIVQRIATQRPSDGPTSCPSSIQVNPAADVSYLYKSMYTSAANDLERERRSRLAAEAERVLLAEELECCKAELEFERERCRNAEKDVEEEMQHRYLLESGAEDTRFTMAKVQEWERKFREAEKERDRYWARMNENEGFRLRHREALDLISDLTNGRGDAALGLCRAGKLRKLISDEKRNAIGRWVDRAEIAMLAQRSAREIAQRRRAARELSRRRS